MKKFIAFIGLCLHIASGFPESGKWSKVLNEKDPVLTFSKTMFANTSVNIVDIADTLCKDGKKNEHTTYSVQWLLFNTHCFQLEVGINSSCYDSVDQTLDTKCGCKLVLTNPDIPLQWKNGTGKIDCESHSYIPDKVKGPDEAYKSTDQKICPKVADNSGKNTPATPDSVNANHDNPNPKDAGSKKDKDPKEQKENRRKRDAEKKAPTTTTKSPPAEPTTAKPTTIKVKPPTTAKQAADITEAQADSIMAAWKDGPYSGFIVIKKDAKPTTKRAANKNGYAVTIETRDSKDHLLSAADLPYLYFYLVMTIVYVFYGFLWLVMMACYWRDLLRIQYFIGLVIVLGFIEKVFYYSEYEHIDVSGEPTSTRVIIAELVSVVKKTLARALVIVVSVGFGIVKPRLGPTLNKLVAVCGIYFILASVEGCLRVMQSLKNSGEGGKQDLADKTDLIATIPLALCETGIIYWVFSSLLQTIRTLRLRRNVVKYSLYKHFGNLLVFTILVSVAYFIWYVVKIRMADCVTDIRELWLSNGFWAMLFSVVLFVIMILWRPSMNKQRYSPALLMEEDGEDEEDTLMGTEAFEAKKRSQANGKGVARDKRRTREEKVEDDLQWIEDNIPASVADSALQPVLNDSEEEIMTTRFEMSKMD